MTYDSKTTELRGEVGLLSRNVVVQGDQNSKKDEYGSHIMIRGEEGKVVGRFSYLETRHAGQAFQMGRYPIHFHMIGNIIGSYIEGCSIHDTFNRATTIHGVHYLKIKNNVMFNILGHAIFVEDSIESNNIVEDNLVIYVSSSPSLLESDLLVAGIWITHPGNYFRRNHVSGVEFFAYWFDLPGHPTGPSSTNTICPVAEKLGQFDDNYGHSSGVGFRIYPFFRPLEDPCGIVRSDKLKDPFSANEPHPAIMKNNVFYMNYNGVFQRDIGAVQHHNVRCFGNDVDIVIASPMWARDGQASIEDSLFVGFSEITEYHGTTNGHGIHTARKDGFLLKNSKFINYKDTFLISTCNGCSEERHRDIGGRRTTFEGVSFENVTNKPIKFGDGEKDKDILYDKTGTLITLLTKKASSGGWITPWNEHLNIPECQKIEDEKICNEHCAVCTLDVSILRLEFTFEDSDLLEGGNIKIMNLDVEGEDFSPDQADESKYGLHTWRNVMLTEGFEGFTVNLATKYNYNIHFNKGVDFNDISVMNNPYWESDDLLTTIRFNNTLARETFETTLHETLPPPGTSERVSYDYTESPISILSSAPTSSNSFGDFYFDSEKSFLTFKIDGKKRGFFKSIPASCGNNCPTNEEDQETEDTIRKWSDAASWGANGQVPQAGDEVVIEPTWNMVVDVETAILAKVTVQGKLSFSDDFDSATLNAKTIDIEKNGELVIGEPDAVFTKKAQIVLHGTGDDDSTQIGPGFDSLIKGIIVRGKMHFYGARTNPVWTMLTENAAKDATTIKVDPGSGFNWKAGDKLVIGSSSTNKDEIDEAVIKSVNANGTIELETPLKFFHYGASQAKSISGAGTLDMRAEVGNLSRNIVIEATEEGTLGCSILVPRYTLDAPVTETVQGSLILDSVEVAKCGQKDTDNAAVNLRKLEKIGSDTIKIMYSSIRDSQGRAMTMMGAKGVSVTHNVIFNSRKIGIYMEEEADVSVENNLMIKVRSRENYISTELLDVISGIYRNNQAAMEGGTPTVIRNNRVSSVAWFAYIVVGYDCKSTQSSPNFADNVAHSCMAGWFPLKVADVDCQQFSHFHAYKNSEEGFVNRFHGAELVVKDMILADNKNALVVNGGQTGKETWGGTVTMKDLVIFGQALPDCAECYAGDGNCEHNGIYSTLFNENDFSFRFEPNRLPLHNSTDSRFNLYGKQFIEDIRFENFAQSNACATKPTVFRVNPFYQDGVVSVFSKQITLQNVDEDNKFYFPEQTIHPDGIVFCGKRDCTGIYNVPFYDIDGSFSGGQAKHYVGNNQAARNDPDCTFKKVWNVNECTPQIGQLNIMNKDSDRTPVITPAVIKVIDYDKDYDDKLKFTHEIDANHELAGLVKLGRMHEITYAATMPSGLVYQLMTANASASEYIILKVHSENPAPLFVSKDKKKVRSEVLKENEEVDFTGKLACGTNFYVKDESLLYFVLTGEDSCRLEIKNSNAIALNARMDISVDDFYKNDGLTNFIDRVAASLNISRDRIRVVRVYTGSTHVDFFIEREGSIEEDADKKDEAITELETLAETFREEVDKGTLDLGAPVIGIESDLKVDNTPEPEDPNNPDEGNEPSDGTDQPDPEEEGDSNLGLYLGLVIGIPLALIVMAGLAYAIYYFKNKQKSPQENNYQKTEQNTVDDKEASRNENIVYQQSYAANKQQISQRN